MKFTGESGFCLALMAFFAYLWYAAAKIPVAKGSATDVGANFFPLSISILLFVLTTIVFLMSIRSSSVTGETEHEKRAQAPSNNVIASTFVIVSVLVILLLYIIFLPRIGFIISTIIFLCILTLLLYRFKTHQLMPIKQMAISVVLFGIIVGAIYYTFNNFFQLILP